jgi:putative transcriptional regulator
LVIESRVSELLGRRRESISDLARGAGISYAAAHALYHGTSKAISMEMLEKLCSFFGVQPGDLFVYVPEKGERKG